MVSALFIVTALLYTLSAVLWLLHLARGGERIQRLAVWALTLSLAAHAAFLTADLFATRMLFANIHQSLALLSLLIPAVYLATMRRHRLTVLGAFVTPMTLLLFLAAGLGAKVAHVPDDVRSAILPFHVGVNTLGIVAFTLAFTAAVAYLIQDGLLRRKKVLGVFQRLPALDVLDDWSLRLVMIGFPLFTIGVLTGTFWVTGVHPLSLITSHQIFAVLAWACFGSVLLARVAAGWRGRRAAIGTMVGFVCSLVALAGYLLRDLEVL